ncbi:MAG TPA: hypothetical protein VN257_05870 [Actinotalea sp.]|nr:hypothetical protein [Actinotalea sp.]
MSAPSVRRSLVLLVGAVGTLLVLSACAAGGNDLTGTPTADGDVAGFWQGLWHGLIVPITFVISLFNEGVGIYEVHNNGAWYDFGFVIGVSATFGGSAGGGAASTRRAKG